jgi:2-aminoethylphosphonate-pyruvate transaminase
MTVPLETAADKVLFTPGPLTTSRTVKQAMLRDLGSRDGEFIRVVREVREQLVRLGGGTGAYEAVLVQGSGTFAIEATVGSVVPRGGKLLVLVNGAYGKRIARIADVLAIDHQVQSCIEDQTPDLGLLEATLAGDPAITHVVVVHSETTTGIVNPIREICGAARRAGKLTIVDAMSSFGGMPIDLEKDGIDYLVSSANKCIEGVPGFAFTLARRDPFLAVEGAARSLSLDLHAQWRGLENDGQFRFTPPTHAILAFHRALFELAEEGGVDARAARYRALQRTLDAGMQKMGFVPYLPPELRGHIITSYRYPAHATFEFSTFYDLLSQRGFAIYPGKLTTADCFRIGSIGRIFPSDVRNLLAAVRETIGEMRIEIPI